MCLLIRISDPFCYKEELIGDSLLQAGNISSKCSSTGIIDSQMGFPFHY